MSCEARLWCFGNAPGQQPQVLLKYLQVRVICMHHQVECQDHDCLVQPYHSNRLMMRSYHDMSKAACKDVESVHNSIFHSFVACLLLMPAVWGLSCANYTAFAQLA